MYITARSFDFPCFFGFFLLISHGLCFLISEILCPSWVRFELGCDRSNPAFPDSGNSPFQIFGFSILILGTLCAKGTDNGLDYEGSLLCVGSTMMSWAPIEISDITPHRKKTPEPQQNGQSTAGAMSDGSSDSRVAANGNM
ncbi:hypothetical protein ACFX13_006328 [Malus domestica]